jgi:hypothetical protein
MLLIKMVEVKDSVCDCGDSSLCEMASKRIKMASFHNWYPAMQKLKCTYKSKVYALSDLFIQEYLLKDGMNQPEKQSLEHLSPEERDNFLL